MVGFYTDCLLTSLYPEFFRYEIKSKLLEMESILGTQYLFRGQDVKQMQMQELQTNANSILTVWWLEWYCQLPKPVMSLLGYDMQTAVQITRCFWHKTYQLWNILGQREVWSQIEHKFEPSRLILCRNIFSSHLFW